MIKIKVEKNSLDAYCWAFDKFGNNSWKIPYSERTADSHRWYYDTSDKVYVFEREVDATMFLLCWPSQVVS